MSGNMIRDKDHSINSVRIPKVWNFIGEYDSIGYEEWGSSPISGGYPMPRHL